MGTVKAATLSKEKHMKKLLAGMLVAVGALIVSAAPSYAFQSVSITTVTAQTTTGGVKTAAFSLIVRNVATPLTGGGNETPGTKPETEKPIVVKPPEPVHTPPRTESKPTAPEGEKRKGKKGDG